MLSFRSPAVHMYLSVGQEALSCEYRRQYMASIYVKLQTLRGSEVTHTGARLLLRTREPCVSFLLSLSLEGQLWPAGLLGMQLLEPERLVSYDIKSEYYLILLLFKCSWLLWLSMFRPWFQIPTLYQQSLHIYFWLSDISCFLEFKTCKVFWEEWNNVFFWYFCLFVLWIFVFILLQGVSKFVGFWTSEL